MYPKAARRGVSLVDAATPTHKLNSSFAVAVGEPPPPPARRQAKTTWAPTPIQTSKGKVVGARVFDDRDGKACLSVAIVLNGTQKLSWRDADAVFGPDGAQRLVGLLGA